MTEAMGLLLVAFIGAGCSSAIMAYQYAVGVDLGESSSPSIGTSRRVVEASLGRPKTSRVLPDGGRVDTYQYMIRDPGGLKGAAILGIVTAVTMGTLEPLMVTSGILHASRNQQTATITYGPNDRMLAHGQPPSYGPADDAVAALSMAEIADRCRSESLGDQRDFECIVTRLAIWGIE